MKSEYKFVLVDDEPDIKQIYEMFLSNILGKEFEFLFFANGLECINYMKDNCKIDDKVFLITDINMPVMDGFTLMKNLHEIFNSVEVALCSAYDTSDFKAKGQDLGAVEFLSKPVDFQKVARLIGDRLEDQ